MDLDYQSFKTVVSFSLAQNLTIGASPEVVNIITFDSAFAKCILPSGTTPTGYAEIFKPGNTAGEALLGSESPRIMDFNQTGSPKANGLAAYSIATEQWNNGYSIASGDLVLFSGATNPTPNLPYTAGTGTDLSSSLVECETLMRQLFRDVIRATIAASAGLQAAYPVGSVYINAGVSTNPATLLGFGTWTAYGAGRVIVGLDSGQTEFDTLGETGGAKTHTLITTELPSHTHQVGTFLADAVGANTVSQAFIKTGTPINSNAQQSGSTGSGNAHNNLQPYIVAYMWQRIS